MTRTALVFALILCPVAAVAARGPIPVSPGSVSAETTVAGPCPSFSWTAAAEATAFELAVYAIDPAGQVEARPVLQQRIPGAALSWTPSLEQCLAPGGRYAWSIRALGDRVAGSWSEPSLFRVASRPAEEDLEAALAVVRRYLATGATEAATGVTAQPSRTLLPPAPQTAATGEPGPASRSVATRNPEATAATVGLKAEVEDGTDVSFGLYGLSAADETGSAGVVGETTAASGTTYGVIGRHTGGAGSGAAGAFSSLGGADILRGYTGGVLVLAVDGAGNLLLGQDLLCASCIQSSDIANNSIFGTDIADGSITGADIASDSISQRDLAFSSVGGDELDTIYAVSVECNGECNDITLGQACAASGEAGRRPIAVDCENVDSDSGSACGGDNTCASFTMSSNSLLSSLCDDGSGWDAQVYCLDDDN